DKQSLEEIYETSLAEAPTIAAMLKPATLVSELRAETDYSYAAEQFAGPGYFISGDAACFLDPLLSTGVHLAMLSGVLSAAQTCGTSLAGAPAIAPMLQPATLVSGLRAETAYSYAAEQFAGPGYFISGDAACFLDPLLSTGVHLAMLSGLLSAASICSIDRG